jgi:hypothetical protein
MPISLLYSHALVNKDEPEDRLPMDGFAFRHLLQEALDHGWEPAGTSEPCVWRYLDYDDVRMFQEATDEGWCLPGSYGYTYDMDSYNYKGWGSFYFIPDPDKTWDGNYIRGQGQEVTAQDAVAIADALQKALDSVADYDVHVRQLTRSEIANAEAETEESYKKRGEECPGYMKPLATEHIRRGLLLERDLKEIIAFCRKGAFLIYY